MTTKTTTPCYRCGSEKEPKPWGPGRAFICAKCALGDPELDAIARMYAEQDREKAKSEALEKMRRDNPGMTIIELPVSLIEALMSLGGDSTEPCDCPRCTAKRASESKHAN
jgi:hypothetical protein